jgi:Fe-S-cluster-containing dehydrogenase component
MTRYALLIDTTRCIGCNVCTVACKDQFVENDWPPYSLSQPDSGHLWMFVAEKEWGKGVDVKVRYIPQPCMLCEKPPCVPAATDGAAYKRADGIVIFDLQKSKGQKQIVDSCPYGRIYWNDQLSIPQKCNLCVHRLEKGLQPACVQACPTEAITIGDEGALAAGVAEKKAKPLSPELGADPKVYYAGLP